MIRYTYISPELINDPEPWFKDKYEQVISLPETMLNSTMMRDYMLDYNYTQGHQNLSAEQIWEVFKIQDWQPKILFEQTATHGKSMAARTGENIIVIYQKTAKNKNVYRLAATFFHEYAHLLGFHHDGVGSPGSPAFRTINSDSLFRKNEPKNYPKEGYCLTRKRVWWTLWLFKILTYEKI